MKGELIKRKDRWDLYNKSDGSKIASTAPNPQGKLSIINCESIERGYDLDALKKEFIENQLQGLDSEDCEKYIDFAEEDANIFIEGFQKALELMGDKKFSEEEACKIWKAGQEYWKTSGESITFEELIERKKELLQQEEWDVIVETKKVIDETKIVGSVKGVKGSGDKVTTYKSVPKLDENGCLILKRI